MQPQEPYSITTLEDWEKAGKILPALRLRKLESKSHRIGIWDVRYKVRCFTFNVFCEACRSDTEPASRFLSKDFH